jgi:hypothetical protein
VSVDDLNIQLLSSLDDGLAGLGREVVGKLGSVSAVVHQQKLDILGALDGESVEAIRTQVLGLFVRSITSTREANLTLELSSDSRINTLRFSPGFLL